MNSGCFLSFDRLCPCWPFGEQADGGRWFYAASKIHVQESTILAPLIFVAFALYTSTDPSGQEECVFL